MSTNILFLIAHPDDEAFGPYGTIATLARDNKVTVVSLCNGARPNFEEVAKYRAKAFKGSCDRLGVDHYIYDNPDLSLTYNATVKIVEDIVRQLQPEIVYTHNISDLNNDHKVVAEAAMVACRPKPESTVDALYFFEVPASTDWTFGQGHPAFESNIYVDISDFIETKKWALSLYTTETYEFPDARSIESMVTRAKFRGSQVGLNYAEAFRLVFSRCHKIQ